MIRAEADTQDERQHHQRAGDVTQELRLDRWQLQRDDTQQRIQHPEDRAGQHHPCHALHHRSQQQGRDGKDGTHRDSFPDRLRGGKEPLARGHLAASLTAPIHSRRNTVTDPNACPNQSSENSPRTASCAPAST